VDTQPFSINIIELASKMVLVRTEVADKGKCKNIIIGDPHTSNISQGEVARKTSYRKTNKSGATGGGGGGGRHNWTAQQSAQNQASRTVRHMRANGPADSAR
jgi:hypothetical protein